MPLRKETSNIMTQLKNYKIEEKVYQKSIFALTKLINIKPFTIKKHVQIRTNTLLEIIIALIFQLNVIVKLLHQ